MLLTALFSAAVRQSILYTVKIHLNAKACSFTQRMNLFAAVERLKKPLVLFEHSTAEIILSRMAMLFTELQRAYAVSRLKATTEVWCVGETASR